MQMDKLQQAFALAYTGGHRDIARLIWEGCGQTQPPTLAEVLPTKAEARTERQAAPKARPAKPASAPKSPIQDKILAELAIRPLTNAELASVVYPNLDRKVAGMNLSVTASTMRRKGLIEKRPDPTAGNIDKWFRIKEVR